eukprot:Nk52_evm4s210 gene=Nk52_evmTU4s210
MEMQEWHQFWLRHRAVRQSIKDPFLLLNDESVPFMLSLEKLEAVGVPQGTLDKYENPTVKHQVLVTLFDSKSGEFFGNTWMGAFTNPIRAGQSKNAAFRADISYHQNVYFHSKINDLTCLAIVEVVVSISVKEKVMETVGAGWTFIRIFENTGKLIDSGNKHRSLVPIQGSHVLYTMRTHMKLLPAIHLVPENYLIGDHSVVPGIHISSDERKRKLYLKSPELLRTSPHFVSRLCITLKENVETFEGRFLNFVNINRLKAQEADGDQLGQFPFVLERRMTIGVHNGYQFVKHFQIGHLIPDKNRLTLNSIMEFKECVDEPHFALIFQLEYKVAVPIAPQIGTLEASVGFPKEQSFVLAWLPVLPFPGRGKSIQKGEREIKYRMMTGPCLNAGEALIFTHLRTKDRKVPNVSRPGTEGFDIGSMESLTEQMNKVRTSHKETQALPIQLSFVLTPEQVPSGETFDRPGISATSSMLKRRQAGSSPSRAQEKEYRSAHSVPSSPSASRAKKRYENYSEDESSDEEPRNRRQQSPSVSRSAPPKMRPREEQQPDVKVTEVKRETKEMKRYYDERRPVVKAEQFDDRLYDDEDYKEDMNELQVSARSGVVATQPRRYFSQGVGYANTLLSRAAKARLDGAGFPKIVDLNGRKPYDVGEIAPTPKGMPTNTALSAVDLNRETNDPLQVNNIVIQFLAYSNLNLGSNENAKPKNVFFTFQFYRFELFTTELLHIGAGYDQHHGNQEGSIPEILHRYKDSNRLEDQPGCQIKYSIDPALMRNDESLLFTKYLFEKTLQVDVWDGDSLLLIGTANLELRHLLRQHRSAVQVTEEVEIVFNDFSTEGSMADNNTTQVLNENLSGEIKGRLFVKLANIGQMADLKMNLKNPNRNSVVVSGHDDGRSADRVIKRKVKAKHMVEKDPELAAAIFSSRPMHQMTAAMKNVADLPIQKRKFDRLQQARQQAGENEEESDGKPLTYKDEQLLRRKEFKLIDSYRQKNKRGEIISMLSDAITTSHSLYPSFGVASYFEYVVENPYEQDCTFELFWNDPELKLISDEKEWRYFKHVFHISTPTERNMLNTDLDTPTIYLRAFEKVNIPFKFQSFMGGRSMYQQQDHHGYNEMVASSPGKKLPNIVSGHENAEPIKPRIIKVQVLNMEKKVIAALDVKVDPQPFFVDRTFRFYHTENQFFKKLLRVPADAVKSSPYSYMQDGKIHTRCSNENVVCECRQTSPNDPQELFLKLSCGTAPAVNVFYVLLYNDPYFASPCETWQFYIHCLPRVDISGCVGQTSRGQLMLRGTTASRSVQCFSSHPVELSVNPTQPFMLMANALNEVKLGLKPKDQGTKHFLVNVVDIEFHHLLSTWLISANCNSPVVTKAYEIVLKRNASNSKRVSYTNPYQQTKIFTLSTSRPDIVSFKETVLEIPPGESRYIQLKFNNNHPTGMTELLIFINDEEDKSEECFCVRALYSDK